MQGELTIISPDGAVTRRPLNNPEHYKDLIHAVGGGIDIVPGLTSFEGKFCDAYVADEGIPKGLSKNQAATELWWSQLDERQRLGNALNILHGPLAIVTGDDEFIAASR